MAGFILEPRIWSGMHAYTKFYFHEPDKSLQTYKAINQYSIEDERPQLVHSTELKFTPARAVCTVQKCTLAVDFDRIQLSKLNSFHHEFMKSTYREWMHTDLIILKIASAERQFNQLL